MRYIENRIKALKDDIKILRDRVEKLKEELDKTVKKLMIKEGGLYELSLAYGEIKNGENSETISDNTGHTECSSNVGNSPSRQTVGS